MATRPPLLRFAPGVRLVRRGTDRLQLGLYDGRRAVLPRTPALLGALGLVEAGLPAGPVPAEVAETLRRLVAAGLLEEPGPASPRAVAVLGEPRGLDVAHLCRAAGLEVDPAAPVTLVVSAGELDRETLDPLLRSSTDHVVVRLVDGGAVLGPFTVPGRTACLRCVDAHTTVDDPDHVAVTARYVRATARRRADGRPEPVDLALAGVAVAAAARDAALHLAGGEPATWSRTLHLAPDAGLPTVRSWSRHPACGCCWGADQPSVGHHEGCHPPS